MRVTTLTFRTVVSGAALSTVCGGVRAIRPSSTVPPSTAVTRVGRVGVPSAVLPYRTVKAVRELCPFGGGVVCPWRAPVLSVIGRSIWTVVTLKYRQITSKAVTWKLQHLIKL